MRREVKIVKKTIIDGYKINIFNGLLIIDTKHPNVIDIINKIENIAKKNNTDFNNLFHIFNSDLVKVYGLKRIINNKIDFLLKFRDAITEEVYYESRKKKKKVYYQQVWNRGKDIHISSDKIFEEYCISKKCSCCLEEFKLNDIITITECNHVFHKKCLQKWNKNSCPNCRRCERSGFHSALIVIKNKNKMKKIWPVIDKDENFINSREFMNIVYSKIQ
jgi:hypothetical protein